MKKRFRIKKNEDFQEIFRKKKSVANRQFVIYILDKPEQKHFRVGLSVSKKLGNAVTRNRIKRYIREAIKELKEDLYENKDFLVIARHPVSDMDFHEVKKSLLHVMKIAKLIKANREL
ncbi:ribonuclease P protein component [Lottiidibacillus patelloidae]|uniref:Ribonuclease P protein component n=1 Tax=Lottiidibacillus patelloidae TaxID=2670334 RepID=A0A263BS84_9BACI|nr:ribonuclease P protein component [Lottiidibacillus patelloidae]OZM56564.1 ribonuclease P protein component [Lottiidibacillus patelloidae]